MKIEPHTITIRQLVDGYRNDYEEGVVAFGGKLDIRPKYQREFIYSDAEQKAVIDTVTTRFVLHYDKRIGRCHRRICQWSRSGCILCI